MNASPEMTAKLLGRPCVDVAVDAVLALCDGASMATRKEGALGEFVDVTFHVRQRNVDGARTIRECTATIRATYRAAIERLNAAGFVVRVRTYGKRADGTRHTVQCTTFGATDYSPGWVDGVRAGLMVVL